MSLTPLELRGSLRTVLVLVPCAVQMLSSVSVQFIYIRREPSEVTTAGREEEAHRKFPWNKSASVSYVWLQGEWEQDLGLLHTYTGVRVSLCSLSASSACTSTARCMETRAKNTIIYSYKYPVPQISSRMSVRAELGARGRSTFGKWYFWTTCIHILEYLPCKALCRSARH